MLQHQLKSPYSFSQTCSFFQLRCENKIKIQLLFPSLLVSTTMHMLVFQLKLKPAFSSEVNRFLAHVHSSYELAIFKNFDLFCLWHGFFYFERCVPQPSVQYVFVSYSLTWRWNKSWSSCFPYCCFCSGHRFIAISAFFYSLTFCEAAALSCQQNGKYFNKSINKVFFVFVLFSKFYSLSSSSNGSKISFILLLISSVESSSNLLQKQDPQFYPPVCLLFLPWSLQLTAIFFIFSTLLLASYFILFPLFDMAPFFSLFFI